MFQHQFGAKYPTAAPRPHLISFVHSPAWLASWLWAASLIYDSKLVADTFFIISNKRLRWSVACCSMKESAAGAFIITKVQYISCRT
jgi:hypothetical protein